VVADAEAMAEGEGPPVPREDGVAARSEEDVHMPEEIWPALLPQGNLPGGYAGGIDYPLDCVREPEGVEAPDVNDDKELQEAGPQGDEGSSIATSKGRGVATTLFTCGAAS
jgi:hypothetical protein